MKGNKMRPTVFLDSNALHFLSTYLRYAHEFGFPPYSRHKADLTWIRNELEQRMPGDIANLVINGAKTLAFLQSITRNDGAAVFCSRLSKAELLYGILDGQAHFRLAREGLSYRMRQRVRDLSQLVAMCLEREDYERLVREVDNLFELLNDNGISIDMVEEDASNFEIVATFAEFMQKNVFLDVLDCWMYGCAVTVQAERIITFDSYFKSVICKVRSSGEGEWAQVRQNIQSEMERVFGEPISVKFVLPEASKLPECAPEIWL